MTTSTDRLHALDAVRGFALLAGVVLHATMSFLPGFAATGWPIVDQSPSTTLGVTFFVIHIFRMTLFFMIAGYFAHLLFHRRGMRAFIRNRALRIVVPLIVGWIVVMPMIVAAFAWSAAGAAPVATAPPPPAAPLLAFPLTHLWFLYVLVLLYGATLAIRSLVFSVNPSGSIAAGIDRGLRFTVDTALAPLVLAIPVFAALVTTAEWRRWFGIPTPDQSLIPNLAASAAFVTAFAFGWVLERQSSLLQSIRRQWAIHLGAAVAATAACLSIVGAAPEYGAAPDGNQTIVFAALYAAGSWWWSFALVGIALRFLSSESPVRRYVSDASYWVYIMHLPVVFLLQTAVMAQPWHWSVKFPAILSGALALLFASYHVLVRRTFIGEVLNGTRHAIDRKTAWRNQGAAPTPAELVAVRKRFGKTLALDGVDLDVRPGELLAVLGPNGAGKSTAIALMLGLLEPDEGGVKLFGLPPREIEARHGVGVMMQEVALAPELKVRELIDLTASYYPSPLTTAATLELAGITELADRPYARLSTGQKRNIQFALAVCGRPGLLFLDEPTVGLDVQAREALWTTVRGLLAGGVSIVLTTHYLEEAEALADRVIVLAKGRVIAQGSVDEMRALVDRKRVRVITRLAADEIGRWPGVAAATIDGKHISIVATDADAVVRRLLEADPEARDLEVQRAGLADAFTSLTQEAA